MRSLIDWFMPPDCNDQRAVNAWHWKVAVALTAIMICGALAWKNVAWSGDLDKAIDEKLKPIVKEQQAQRVVMDDLAAVVRESLAEATSSKIRANIAARCKSKTFTERDRLNEEIRKLQILYAKYTGAAYPEPSCSEI